MSRLVLGRGDHIGQGNAGVEALGGHDQVRHKRGWFGTKNQKPSHGGSVLVSETWVGLFWGKENPIWVGYARIKVVRGHNRVRCKGGGASLGQKQEKQAVGVQFWLAKCEQAVSWVEGTLFGWGTLGLRW